MTDVNQRREAATHEQCMDLDEPQLAPWLVLRTRSHHESVVETLFTAEWDQLVSAKTPCGPPLAGAHDGARSARVPRVRVRSVAPGLVIRIKSQDRLV
jgi:hypothetical protein